SAPCRMSAMRASWTIARTIATIGSQSSPPSASLRMTTAAVTSTTTPRRKGRSSSTVTRSVYEVGDRLVVDDGGEHVLGLGGADDAVGVLRCRSPGHDLEGDLVLGHRGGRRGQGGQRRDRIEVLVDAQSRGDGVEESVEPVGSGQRLGALRPVDDGLHDHLLVVHAGDVAAVADGMAGSGQREGVRAVEHLLTGREIELRLVVVKRFVEVDGNTVE